MHVALSLRKFWIHDFRNAGNCSFDDNKNMVLRLTNNIKTFLFKNALHAEHKSRKFCIKNGYKGKKLTRKENLRVWVLKNAICFNQVVHISICLKHLFQKISETLETFWFQTNCHILNSSKSTSNSDAILKTYIVLIGFWLWYFFFIKTNLCLFKCWKERTNVCWM